MRKPFESWYSQAVYNPAFKIFTSFENCFYKTAEAKPTRLYATMRRQCRKPTSDIKHDGILVFTPKSGISIDLFILEGKRNGGPNTQKELIDIGKLEATMSSTIIFLMEKFGRVLDMSKVRTFGFFFSAMRWDLYEARMEMGPGNDFHIGVYKIGTGEISFKINEIWTWIRFVQAMIALARRIRAVVSYLTQTLSALGLQLTL